MATTFYGKIKARGDFVRIGLGEAFDLPQWLEASLDAVRKQKLALPEATFLYRKSGAKKVLFGVTAPSSDAVGRTTPLALFLTLEAAEAAQAFAQLPSHTFVAPALALARRCNTLTVEALEAEVASLPTTGFAAAETTSPLTDAAPLARYYAFRTLALACQQAKTAPDSGIMVDCPVSKASELPYWLELTTRLLKSPAVPPSFFCSEQRLLIAFSEPSPLMISFLAKPESQSAKLWPLVTSNARALETAQTALDEKQRAAIDRAASAAELAEVLA